MVEVGSSHTPSESGSVNALRTALWILSVTSSLAVFLFAIRASILQDTLGGLFSGWALRQTLGASYFDFAMLATTAGASFVLCGLLRHRSTALIVLQRVFLGCALLLLLAALLNVRVVGMLGTPVNYQWLYFSDFLTAFDARQAIADTVSLQLVGIGAATVLGFLVANHLLFRGMTIVVPGWRRAGAVLLVVTTASTAYFYIAGPYMLGRRDYALFANPVYVLVESMCASDQPSLASAETPIGNEDFATVSERGEAAPLREPSGIRNVLIFMHESVSPEYLEVYGSHFAATPVLTRARQRSLRFTNIYTHAPSTTKAVLSLLCSIYPWVSYRSVMLEHPGVEVTSLSSVLRERGYRTGFFTTTDLRYQKLRSFLRRLDFDVVRDLRGTNDARTAAELMDWVAEKPSDPFFAMVLTYATHFPYFPDADPGEWIDFGVGEKFNRYLNALLAADAALGSILEKLDELKLTDSTLVVVLADHGEAFGRHGQIGHATVLYEENVRIPFLLINPRLFHGEENPVIGGLVDTAPTILDLLGVPLPGDWQGRSLFSTARVPRVYFFAAWAEILFGLREGDRKFIYNASHDIWEVYDLRHDRQETRNLAEQEAGRLELVRHRLAAWVQNQIEYFKHRIRPETSQKK